jgi:catechol 2,3-dioxygenase-like lactoylglutathione lyase family enzyme
MEIKLSQCFIAVDDHDKALAFYRDVLGPRGAQRRRVRGDERQFTTTRNDLADRARDAGDAAAGTAIKALRSRFSRLSTAGRARSTGVGVAGPVPARTARSIVEVSRSHRAEGAFDVDFRVADSTTK